MHGHALDDPEVRREFEEELLVGEATENICGLLHSLGVSQKELAKRLGVSESRTSQICSGRENLTLRSLAAIGWALGVRFDLTPVPMTAAERVGTPCAEAGVAPAWLYRLRRQPTVSLGGKVPSPKTASRLHKAKELSKAA